MSDAGGIRPPNGRIFFVANPTEDTESNVLKSPSTQRSHPALALSTNMKADSGVYYPQSRSNPSLASPSTGSSQAGQSPPPASPTHKQPPVDLTLDQRPMREQPIPPHDQGLQPAVRAHPHTLPRVPVQRVQPSPTAPTPESFTSPTSSTSINTIPSKRILITTNYDNFIMVDVTDLSGADYIVTTICNKLQLTLGERQSVRIWQITDLTGDPLSLAELFDLCFAQADEFGGLKFFVAFNRSPPEMPVPEPLEPPTVTSEVLRSGRRARSPSLSEASNADRSGSDDQETPSGQPTRSPPISRVPFQPTIIPPPSPHRHPFALPVKQRDDSPNGNGRPRSPKVLSPERGPRHHPLPTPPGPSSPNYRSPSTQEDMKVPPAGRTVHNRHGSDAFERETLRKAESYRAEQHRVAEAAQAQRQVNTQRLEGMRAETSRSEPQVKQAESTYRPKEVLPSAGRYPAPPRDQPQPQLVRAGSWVMVPLPNPTEIRAPPPQDLHVRTSPGTRPPLRGRNFRAGIRITGKDGFAVPPPPLHPPPAPPREDLRQPSRPIHPQPPTHQPTWRALTQGMGIDKAKSTGNLRAKFNSAPSASGSGHPTMLTPGARLPLTHTPSSRPGPSGGSNSYGPPRDGTGSMAPSRYVNGSGTSYPQPVRKLPVQGAPNLGHSPYGYPGSLMSPIDPMASRTNSTQTGDRSESSPIGRRGQSPNSTGLMRSPHTRSPGGRNLAFGSRMPTYTGGIDTERANAYGGLEVSSRSPTSPLSPRSTPRADSSSSATLGAAFMASESTVRPEEISRIENMLRGGDMDGPSQTPRMLDTNFGSAVSLLRHTPRAPSPTESFMSGMSYESFEDGEDDSIWNKRPNQPPKLRVQTDDTPTTSLATSPADSTPSARRLRRSTFHDPTWAPRPTAEDVYENLEQFFPHHDLDKPVIEASSGGTSPTGPDYTVAPPPTPINGISGRVRGKKSIRIVAQEHKKRIDRTSKAGETMMTAMQRKRSTKLWGSKLEELPTKGLIPQLPPESPSSAPKPIFKWVRGELIGQGSYGKVYLALNATTGEMIAVKQVELPRTASDRIDTRQLAVVEALKSESETLKDLDHPNIVQYLGFEETPTFLSIFLEYVPGGSVGSCLHKHGKFDEEVTKSFTAQLLDGLEYLHSRNILHRDLKADNILVETSGICKISDFGISKRTEDNAPAMTAMQGTVFWMAPEVINSNKKGYNSKIDIWSVGCVVLEMWAGKRPWSDDEAVAVMFKLYQAKLPPPVPEDVHLSTLGLDFRNQCFAINPDDRPSASELRQHPYLNLQPNWTFTGFK